MSSVISVSKKAPREPKQLSGAVSFRRGMAVPYALAGIALLGAVAAAFPWILRGLPAGPPSVVTGAFVGAAFLLLGIAFVFSAERIARGRRRAFENGELAMGTVTGFGTRQTLFRSSPTPTARIQFETSTYETKATETLLFGKLGRRHLEEGSSVVVAWDEKSGKAFPLIPKQPETDIVIEEEEHQ